MKLRYFLALAALTSATAFASGDTIKKNAVVFQGSDFFGQSCNMALSLIEENGEHVFLTKMGYGIHGQALPDAETSLYRFDISTNSFGDAQNGTGPVTFGGAILNDGSEADMNNLAAYERSGQLAYSIRVETTATSAEDYEEALEEVVADPSQLAAYASTLDQINRVVVKIAHHGHFDAAGCVGFKLAGIGQFEFELDEHDGHDHDDHDDHDDHGDHDDHDHDHGGHDHHDHD